MKITRAVALVGAVFVLAGCASVSTQSDEAALVYDGGSFGEDTTFNQCQGPNLNDYYNPGSTGYIYPRGQRTYDFDSNNDKAERGSIPVVTKDEVTMSSSGLLNFTLNTKCDVLQKFHDQIGLKYGAGAADGGGIKDWTQLLNNYLGVPLQDAMKAAARGYTWRELYGDESKKDEFVDDVLENLPADIRAFAEGDYFESFTLKVPQILPPEALLKQIQEQQVQAERVATINSQKAAQDAEIAQMRQLVELFGPQGYILYRNQLQCEENADSCIPVLPIPQGSNINVTPGG